MILRGPAVHIETDLGDQLERAVGADARKLCEVDPSTELEQGGADLERRRVVLDAVSWDSAFAGAGSSLAGGSHWTSRAWIRTSICSSQRWIFSW